ncbi:hypothetical protein [Nostoc sp. FACHB-110]|uniref:hypothetical protein n=1 Tax=Nostoc sp. FACHB-110 TaxID=2692834 RepID=UPI001687A4E9|nr:hypothetical protein [Nostoc sp. FACHB-110]MBD2439545.1 hypothetical protein [Nostoc sp. FACHB-110]
MADSVDAGNNNPPTGNLGELLRQSPFGVLLEIPGVTEEDIIQAFGKATAGIGNPFGNGDNASNPNEGPYAGNPFANFGNPNAPGSPLTGGVNPWTPINQVGQDPFSGVGNPFAGGSGNPFANGNPFGDGSSNPFAGGNGNPFANGNPFTGGNPFTSGGGFPFA